MYDIIIIGAGPAGQTAALYSVKNKLHTLVIGKSMENHALSELDILKGNQIKEYFDEAVVNGSLEFYNNQQVINLEKNIVSFSVEVNSGKVYYAKSIIIATGEAEAGFDLLTHKDVRGKIKVDAVMSTNIPGIFAAGGAIASLVDDYFISAAQGAQAAVSSMDFLHQKK